MYVCVYASIRVYLFLPCVFYLLYVSTTVFWETFILCPDGAAYHVFLTLEP